jgi:hypothetical protein
VPPRSASGRDGVATLVTFSKPDLHVEECCEVYSMETEPPDPVVESLLGVAAVVAGVRGRVEAVEELWL